jgi:hypothetical protein
MNKPNIDYFQAAIIAAKKLLNSDNPDGHLAIYMVRDFNELKELGLDELAWGFHKEGYVSVDNARWFFEQIEKERRKIK